MNNKIKEYHIGVPNNPNKKLAVKRFEEILNSNVLSNGDYVRDLEFIFEKYLGVKHAIAVYNNTIALELAISSIWDNITSDNLGDHLYIAMPTFSSIATAHSVVNCGFLPLFIDIKNDYTIDLNDLSNKLKDNKQVAGILACNLYGNICEIEWLDFIAEQEKLPLIYNSSHALSIYNQQFEKYIGNFGTCEVFSLHSNEVINCGEGGIVTTNNDKLADILRKRRVFGLNPNTAKIDDFGTNARMTEFQAALAITNFEEIQEITSWNFENFKSYKELLPSVIKLNEPNTYFSNFSYITIEVDKSIRDMLIDYLHKHSIFAHPGYFPLHLSKVYSSNADLKKSAELSNTTVILPNGLSIDREGIKYICETISKFFKGE